jgi:hypothetical protein
MLEENNSEINEALNALGISEVLPAVYEDLLQPAAKELGSGLVVVARAVTMALAPIEGAVWGYDKIRDWLAVKLTQKLADHDDDAIQPPPLNIAGPAIQNLMFAAETPSLREMYANLIAASMDIETAYTAHPSFVRIIEQLSPDEGKILAQLSGYAAGDSICHEILDHSGFNNRSDQYVSQQWAKICSNASTQFNENTTAYMDNLIRLRLIAEIRENKSRLVPEGGDRYGTWDAHLDETSETTLELTELGERFILACVGSDSNAE